MTEAALDRHDNYHRFSYGVEVGVLASALLLARHPVGYFALSGCLVAQGIAAGLAPVEVHRLKDSDFREWGQWHAFAVEKLRTARFYMKCCLAGALVAAPFSTGLSVLAVTGGLHLWGEARFHRAIKRRMTKALKLHTLEKDKVDVDDLDPKLRKIKAKTITDDALKALSQCPKLRKLRVDTFGENQKLPDHKSLTTVVLKSGLHALVDHSSIERIVIKEQVEPKEVRKILDGNHRRLRVIELPSVKGMRAICDDSYHLDEKKKEIHVSMR